jgi:hypothetical protein
MAVDKEKEMQAFFALWKSLLSYWEILIGIEEYGNRLWIIERVGLFWHELFTWNLSADILEAHPEYSALMEKTEDLLREADALFEKENQIPIF